MPFLPLDTLKTGASEMGIKLSEQQLDQLDRFAALVVEANSKFNLTRITEPERIVTEHYLDSLLCLWSLEPTKGARVIDVGTGAGFPCVPIKIVRPDLDVTLLDGTMKKVRFLSEAVETLGLRGIRPIHGRAEALGHEKAHREHYDIAYARALADLRALAELCLPLARPGGHVVASKSAGVEAEIEDARPIIGQLGGTIEKIVRTHISGTHIQRTLVVLVKTKRTPAQFPRAYALIARSKGRTGL